MGNLGTLLRDGWTGRYYSELSCTGQNQRVHPNLPHLCVSRGRERGRSRSLPMFNDKEDHLFVQVCFYFH